MSQDQFDKAEELMAGVPPIPQSAAIYYALGMIHARYGRLPNAITNYIKSATVQPTNDLNFHCLFPLLVQAGRIDDYDEWRSKAMGQFQSTTDPEVAERMGLDCLLLPAPAGVVQRAVKMIDNNATTPSRPTDEFVKGLAAYRLGQYADAAASLEKAVHFLPNPTAATQARLILAMARHQLGQADDTPIIDEKKLRLGGPDWNDQMTTAIFAREAHSVIGQ